MQYSQQWQLLYFSISGRSPNTDCSTSLPFQVLHWQGFSLGPYYKASSATFFTLCPISFKNSVPPVICLIGRHKSWLPVVNFMCLYQAYLGSSSFRSVVEHLTDEVTGSWGQIFITHSTVNMYENFRWLFLWLSRLRGHDSRELTPVMSNFRNQCRFEFVLHRSFYLMTLLTI